MTAGADDARRAAKSRFRVRVHPGARREGFHGWHGDGSLKFEVRAAPEGGRANQELEKLVAAELGLKKSQVSVVSGAGSRSKVIEVTGMENDALERLIQSVWPGHTHDDE